MKITTFRSNKRQAGATMVEYAIMVALIAAVAIGVVRLLGQETSGTFTEVTTSMQGS